MSFIKIDEWCILDCEKATTDSTCVDHIKIYVLKIQKIAYKMRVLPSVIPS